MKSVLRLGTRRSLLALAQSRWVKSRLEAIHSGLRVELVGIETKGDQIQHLPLQKVEGKDFFVAEIDRALISNEVDFAVHSLKDLSLTRPKEITVAAVPARENPRDVILFGPHILEQIKAGKPIRIGTSSPRRLENIPEFLESALPRVSGKKAHSINWVEIRGNVNTRLSRVHEPLNSERYLDGVVLAHAGLNRLWNDSEGRKELQLLTQGVRWMVLPLPANPTAPGQGALSIECRASDTETKELIGVLHDVLTDRQVKQEREVLSSAGGGCHQRFGVSVIRNEILGDLQWIKGVLPNHQSLDELKWNSPALSVRTQVDAWDGQYWRSREEVSSQRLPYSGSIQLQNRAIFVSHSRALDPNDSSLLNELHSARIWVSGESTWFRLAELGIWVEGCGEGLGLEHVGTLVCEKVLRLPDAKDWVILTHSGAAEEENPFHCQAIATYQINLDYQNSSKEALRQATHVFWSSGSQYLKLKEEVRDGVVHACGPGKTASVLRAANRNPLIFPNVEEWRKWIRKHQE